jgi:SH3-like domain-containing protein
MTKPYWIVMLGVARPGSIKDRLDPGRQIMFGQSMSWPTSILVKCRLSKIALVAGAIAGGAVSGLAAQSPQDAVAVGSTGLPVPRFVSLKSDRVNLRQGPGTDYPTAWVFRRAGLPVEVVKEFESWRQVRDAEGATGWVLGSMLSGRRTAVILPWEVKSGKEQPIMATVRDDAYDDARAIAHVEAGVLAGIIGCDGKWCRVSVGGYRGYIEQQKLWGAYQGEVIK